MRSASTRRSIRSWAARELAGRPARAGQSRPAGAGRRRRGVAQLRVTRILDALRRPAPHLQPGPWDPADDADRACRGAGRAGEGLGMGLSEYQGLGAGGKARSLCGRDRCRRDRPRRDGRSGVGGQCPAAGMPVQGNLDPLALIAGGELLRSAVTPILDALGDRPHIFNLGHGIQQDTPIAHVEELLALGAGRE